jgi:hypothetical protein
MAFENFSFWRHGSKRLISFHNKIARLRVFGRKSNVYFLGGFGKGNPGRGGVYQGHWAIEYAAWLTEEGTYPMEAQK